MLVSGLSVEGAAGWARAGAVFAGRSLPQKEGVRRSCVLHRTGLLPRRDKTALCTGDPRLRTLVHFPLSP
ncbi:hypothetical protein GCM10009863_12670 [Streptomyces axinellae]|uniref:Uncharacterized protein n=1 Tax=Streptomyces axinellae TaxID=552788 RepID=A0ABN3PVJ9_9ACTN